jgi:hypothetical protein
MSETFPTHYENQPCYPSNYPRCKNTKEQFTSLRNLMQENCI